jgi:hypothetical protein
MAEETIPIRRTTVPVPDFVTNAATTQQKVTENKYPTQIVPLPTRGWFYPDGHPLSTGEVEMKEMTAKEEDILANQELIKRGKVLDKLIESLLIDKTIKPEDILVPDKNAIFLSIRRLAYGDDYPVSITCPQCNAQSKVSINLSSLENKPFDFDSKPKGQNSFSYTLPNSKIEVTYKLLNQLDENSIDAELSHAKKVSKETTKELTTRLTYIITSVNGDTDKGVIRRFVNDKLSAKDSFALRKQLKENNPDVDMSFLFKCNECELERRTDVPIGASFLWPDLDA